MKTGSSYCSQSELPITLGLGGAQRVSLRVTWPDGRVEPIGPLDSNRAVTVTEGGVRESRGDPAHGGRQRRRAARAVACMLICALPAACGRAQRAPTEAAQETREAAYRANNRGVGFLEQFAYDRAIAAFQEALRIDPAVRLARINLAIALFHAGRTQEAAASAGLRRRTIPRRRNLPICSG